MRKLVFASLAVLATSVASAAPITRSQAMARASKSLSAMGVNIDLDGGSLVYRAPSHNVNAETQPYYIFADDASWVIAAGDDAVPAVLGYSNTGTIDTDNMPEGLVALLEQYEAAIEDGTFEPMQAAGMSAIAPLLPCKWNQGDPFNKFCPTINGNLGYTGCVATAMAQVMKYHQWPAAPLKEIPAYTTRSLQLERPALAASGFPAWSDMQDYFGYKFTNDDAATAVSQLMLYVGQSVEMDYKASSSGAYSTAIAPALVEYFDYAGSTRLVYQSETQASTWTSLLYTELAQKRPVIYTGSKYNGGGHAFVVDGYDNSGMWHVNWGWGGTSDGYYQLLSLRPALQSTGSSGGADGYNYGTSMIVGIAPQSASMQAVPLCMYPFLTTGGTFSRSSSSSDFTGVNLAMYLFNRCGTAMTFQYGMAIGSGSDMTILGTGSTTLPYNDCDPHNIECTFPSSLASGTYKVYSVYRMSDQDSWKVSDGDANYFEVTIDGNTLTAKPVTNDVTASQYTVNSSTINDTWVGRETEVVLNLTNSSAATVGDLYLIVNDTTVSQAVCAIMPGEAGDVSWHFIAASTGTKTIKVSTDANGNNVLWTSTATFTAAPAASLSGSSITISDLTGSTVEARAITGSCTVKNNGTSTFDDYIIARLYRRVGEYSGSPTTQVKLPVTIDPSGSQAVNFSFDHDLKVGEDYFVMLHYYNETTLTLLANSSFFTYAGPAQAAGDVNGDGTIDIDDVNIIINIILGNATATTAADVDGNGTVDIDDVNAVINLMLN